MILRRGAAVWAALAIGSNGKVFASDGTDPSWTFSTLITSVGTIASGVWNGTKVALGFGGTGADLTGTGPGILKQASLGANVTVGAATTDLSDVSTSGLADKNFFVWDSATSKWKNRSTTLATSYLDAMVGDSGAGGTKGMVPAPAAGAAAAGKFLKADGTFAVPPGTSTGTVTNTGTLTNHAPIIGTGGADIKATAAMTNGQLLIGSTGADPVPAALTAGSNITITNAAGAITVAAATTGGGGAGFAPLALPLVTHADVTINGAAQKVMHASTWSNPGASSPSLTAYYLSLKVTASGTNNWLIFWDTTNTRGYVLDLQGDGNLVWYSMTNAGNTVLASATSGGTGRILTTQPTGNILMACIVGVNAASDNTLSARENWTEIIYPFRTTTYSMASGTWELYVTNFTNCTPQNLYQVDLQVNPFMG